MAEYELVQAGFGSPHRQNRWTIAFRYILAVPHYIWLELRAIAAFVLVILGWFAALITGRMPSSFARILSNFVTYQLRVNSYVYLMNDTYPSFSSSAESEVNLDIPLSNVRRWAVLFRYFMMIPANLVIGIVSLGLSVALPFIWLIVLIKGEMPLSLFGAMSAILRFQARTTAYAFMLTGKYPGELFGERADELGAPLESAPSSDVSDGAVLTEPAISDVSETAPLEMTTSSVASSVDDDVHAAMAAPPTGEPVTFTHAGTLNSSFDAPRTARLVLTKGAKNILVVLIVLGSLASAALLVVDITVIGKVSSFNSLVDANKVLSDEINVDKSLSQSCSQSQGVCLKQYYSSVASSFLAFKSNVQLIDFPSSARSDATALVNDTSAFAAQLLVMAQPGTAITSSQTSKLQTLGTSFDGAYARLISDVGPSF